MLDFVSAAFYELTCRHKRGHMPAHPQAPRMGTIGDDRNQLRSNRRVNLNLGVAVVGVPIDVLNRLLGGVDPHLGRTCEFSSTVDDAGLQNARPELRAVVKARDTLKKGIGVI